MFYLKQKYWIKVIYYQIITPGSTVKILPNAKEIKSDIIFKNTDIKNKNIYDLMEEFIKNSNIREIHKIRRIFDIYDK